jgi:4-carboxymuconolactone decarboxylase
MKKALYSAILILAAVTTNVNAQDQSIFPLGEKAKNINHTGDVWLSELNKPDSIINSQISLAVFAPNAKLNWHTHSGGQILLITDGIGYYQEKGKPVQTVHKGDVLKCLPDVEHWHGSTPKTGVTYLAVSPKSKTTWLHPVAEEEYRSFKSPTRISAATMNTPIQTNRDQNLSTKQQAIVCISAVTGKGDLSKLKTELNAGLDAGLTTNQIRESIVHVYAYAGFPRSLRGLQTLMSVLDERRAKGINDEKGAEASPIMDGRSKYARGKAILEKLTGVPEMGPKTGYAAFAPEIEVFLKEHLFADIFERDVLTYSERELVTVSVLSSIGGVEPMLRSHLNICLNVGLSPAQLQQFVLLIKPIAGEKGAASAQSVLDEVLKNKK